MKKTHIVIGILAAAMLNNLLHLANLYDLITLTQGIHEAFRVSKEFNQVISIFVVLVFDFSILFLVVNAESERDLWLAKVFAVVLVFVNLLFWRTLDDIYQWQTTIADTLKMSQFLAKIIFSFFFSFIIYEFSEKYAKLARKDQTHANNQQDLSKLESEYTYLLAQLEQAGTQLASKEEQEQQLVLATEQLKEQLIAARTDRDFWEGSYQLELAQRTLYTKDGKRKIYDNMKALAGALRHLSEDDRSHHDEAQKLELAKWKKIVAK